MLITAAIIGVISVQMCFTLSIKLVHWATEHKFSYHHHYLGVLPRVSRRPWSSKVLGLVCASVIPLATSVIPCVCKHCPYISIFLFLFLLSCPLDTNFQKLVFSSRVPGIRVVLPELVMHRYMLVIFCRLFYFLLPRFGFFAVNKDACKKLAEVSLTHWFEWVMQSARCMDAARTQAGEHAPETNVL